MVEIGRRCVEFSELEGLVFDKVAEGCDYDSEAIVFSGNRTFVLVHEQDCCEAVFVEDICGDLSDIEGAEIILADEAISQSDNALADSITWSLYRLRTNKGDVTIRFFGSSNGYYSETATLYEEIQGEARKW